MSDHRIPLRGRSLAQTMGVGPSNIQQTMSIGHLFMPTDLNSLTLDDVCQSR